jgi:FkbM family methyltransferase
MSVRTLMSDVASAAVSALPPPLVRKLPAAPRASSQLLMNRALKRRPRSFVSRSELGFVLAGNTSDLIQRYVYLFGVWEPDTTAWVAKHLRPGDVVIDIGANIGYFSLLAASRVGASGTVIAFEPVPSIGDLFEANVARNGFQVDLRRVAVSDEPGTIEMFKSSDTNIGRSSTQRANGSHSEGMVEMVRVADVVDEALWSSVRLVKIDIEGDEFRALKGLDELLTAMPDGSAVLVEVTPDDLRTRGFSAAEVMDFMWSRGFRAFSIPNSYVAADYARHRPALPQPLTEVPTLKTDVIFVKSAAE